MSFSTTNAIQNISGNVTAAAATYTPSFVKTNATGAATTTLKTVPAGRKYTIIGYTIGVTSNAASQAYCNLNANGTPVCEITAVGSATVNDNHTMTVTLPKESGIVVNAGNTISWTNSANGQGYCNVIYVDEAV